MGVFGAAAASGKLLGLTTEQMIHALGIAFSQAAGNRQCIIDGALTKRLQAGQAASSGVFAASLAAEGFTAAQNIFLGRFGFFELYQPNGYDPEKLLEGLGSTFRGDELSFKPYACGRPQHAMLDAAIRGNGLESLLPTVISTHEARTYKPDPRAYGLGIEALRLPRERIVFAAFAGWDAAGAKLFGYPTYWVNRLQAPAEELGAPAADGNGRTLTDLAAFMSAFAPR